MVLTDDFVYVHLPKSAGTFVTHVLRRVYGDRAIDVDKHGTCSDIPATHRGRPVFSTVRNPYERYVSQYRFGWWRLHPESFCGEAAMREMFPHYPDLSFADYLELSNSLFLGCFQGRPTGFVNQRFSPERRLGWHTEQFVRFFFRRPQEVYAAIDENRLESGRYREDLLEVRFLHVEQINRELYDFLVENGHPPPDVAFVLEAERVLPKEGGRAPGDRWQDYYTPELLDFVRTRERMIFDVFPEYDLAPEEILSPAGARSCES